MDFRDNIMSVVEKLKETLKRNHNAKIIDSTGIVLTDYIEFSVPVWSSNKTESIFKYCGIISKIWLTEWQINPISTKNVKVILWIKKTPENCQHEFIYRENWSMNVCQLCGIMVKKKG